MQNKLMIDPKTVQNFENQLQVRANIINSDIAKCDQALHALEVLEIYTGNDERVIALKLDVSSNRNDLVNELTGFTVPFVAKKRKKRVVKKKAVKKAVRTYKKRAYNKKPTNVAKPKSKKG